MNHLRTVATTLGTLLLAACSTDLTATAPVPQSPDLQLVFPNARWYRTTDDATAVLQQPDSWRPVNFMGTAVDWRTALDDYDGFSPLQSIVIPVTGGDCPALLQPGDEADSVADGAPLLLIENRGSSAERRVPWFGEAGDDPTLCEVFPLDRYADGSRMTVALGQDLAARLPAGAIPSQDAVETGLAGYSAAWEFPVGTLANRVRKMYAVAEATYRWLDAGAEGLVETHTLAPDHYIYQKPHTLRAYAGTLAMPDFTGEDGLIEWNDDGTPRVLGTMTDTFYVLAPPSVTEQSSVPVVQYGHGLFGDAREIWYGSQDSLRMNVGGIFGAVSWGMAVRYFHRAASALLNPSEIRHLRDQVIQSNAAQLVLSRVLRDEVAPAIAAELDVTLNTEIDYIGISQGGILGSPLMATSRDIRRAVLHVGGGNWTPMMTHSSNWVNEDGTGYGTLLAALVPDARERTYLMAAWQSFWDEFDPALFAPYWTQNSPMASQAAYPVHAERRIYYPYSLDDPQVPNFSSETVMRSGATPLLTPDLRLAGLLDSVDFADYSGRAAEQWDVGGGEPAHGYVRELPKFAEQVRGFIHSGTLSNVCGEGCTFPAP